MIFPETEKDWEENVNWHISEGLFFEEKLYVLFKAIKLTMAIVLLSSGCLGMIFKINITKIMNNEKQVVLNNPISEEVIKYAKE